MCLLLTMCPDLSRCSTNTNELIETHKISKRKILFNPHFIDKETEEEKVK